MNAYSAFSHIVSNTCNLRETLQSVRQGGRIFACFFFENNPKPDSMKNSHPTFIVEKIQQDLEKLKDAFTGLPDRLNYLNSQLPENLQLVNLFFSFFFSFIFQFLIL
eukprot:Sdes_comp18469_c0_seq1m8450